MLLKWLAIFSLALLSHKRNIALGFVDEQGQSLNQSHNHAFGGADGTGHHTASTLVIYVFSDGDSEYEQNLRYFLRHGVKEGDGCHYLIVLQGRLNATGFPQLPLGSSYVVHDNTCYDWGTVGWAIKQGHAVPQRYRYLVFMNSSVRGPFLPVYWPDDVHWTTIFTNRITHDVKLVGATISCEGTGEVDGNPARRNPHVQSYVIATDQVGFQTLNETGTVFACYDDILHTISYSELGSSLAILEAGYNIDSLMLRYKGVDWRNKDNWNCNAGANPYFPNRYDSVDLNPMETVFVKVKRHMVDGDWVATRQAIQYSKWQVESAAQPADLNRNSWNDEQHIFRMRGIWAARQIDPACFDSRHYTDNNKLEGVPAHLTNKQAWEHFVTDGQFRGLTFRFSCKHLLDSNPLNASLSIWNVMDVDTANPSRANQSNNSIASSYTESQQRKRTKLTHRL